uniref:Uncharacterized protein n=1 Tax=Lotharella globosa TaxID=91324 RepID=A0A7S4DQL0_9EUKA
MHHYPQYQENKPNNKKQKKQKKKTKKTNHNAASADAPHSLTCTRTTLHTCACTRYTAVAQRIMCTYTCVAQSRGLVKRNEPLGMGATVIPRSTILSATFATCVCIRFWRGPTRSCATSSAGLYSLSNQLTMQCNVHKRGAGLPCAARPMTHVSICC